MDCGRASSSKPHVVCVPAPLQSHIKAMLDLAKLLYHRGFHVTFANTEYNHSRLLESRGPNSLDGLPGFKFESLRDDLPHVQDTACITEGWKKNLLAPLRDLVAMVSDAADVPRVTCIVSDGFMLASCVVAEELGVPLVLYFTISGCALMGINHYPTLKEKGIIPLKDESYLTNGYLDQVIDWIPSMNDIRLRDLPSAVRTTDPNDPMIRFGVETIEKASKASTIVIHTFHALEKDVLDALSSTFPRVHAIGPIPILLNQIPRHSPLKSMGHSLWKEDTKCLQWLDSKPPNSVVYVNFGSITVMTNQQLVEFGWGLANSKHSFLWIIRPDLVIGDAAILPEEFVEDTKERGMVTSWCPQEQVLNHESVGGFLTHCGWNSIMESISAGVPMLCWPFFADQQTNCRYACNEWGIGMEIDNNVERGEVEKLVRELMEGEKGKRMKRKVMEWKGKAEEAIGVHGWSSFALDKLVDEVLLMKH